MSGETSRSGDASTTFARRFILISFVYFIIGTLWMGPFGILIPGPSGNAGSAYDTGKWHLVFIGFLAFAVMGMIYYLAPKIGGRQLHSRRLGSIHFWISNIFLPIGVILEVSLATAYQDFINSAATINPSTFPAGLMVAFIVVLIVFFVGIGAQAVFVYNIYKTMKG